MEQKTWQTVLLPAALIAGLVFLFTLDAPIAVEGEVNALEHWLEIVVGYAAAAAELIAAVIISVGVLRSFLSYIRGLMTHNRVTSDIRLKLGRALALGLELTVASDILRTAVAPTREDLLILAILVLLRTLLNLFLEQELEAVEARTNN